MKSKLIFLAILVILSLFVYGYFNAVPANQTENKPQIEVSPKDFDFGEIQYGKIIKHTFMVKNSGKGILEIKKVATSCGCTTVEIDKKEIMPDEEAELLVTYDSGAMTGARAKGGQERIIYIKSNDPINPQIEAKIYANVK